MLMARVLLTMQALSSVALHSPSGSPATLQLHKGRQACMRASPWLCPCSDMRPR